ncbi:unnamed protein product [Schistosoma curassoni]|uniref:P4Ha_N domain-containing protein n=1 Tax=Schistosoma curassoni TaxID=6186 RepID=A0A183KNF8_9TREM|nr:unnamed protein product [Schistosoma curassoni]
MITLFKQSAHDKKSNSLAVLLCKLLNINAEYYTAVIDITKAWRLSQELVSDLNSYIALEERRLNRIRKVVKVLDANGSISDASSTLSQQNNDLEEYLGNPINAYLTMKRLSSSWKSQISQLVDNVPNGFQKGDTDGSDYLNISDAQNTITMNTIRSRVKQHTDMLPGDNDVSGAVDAILRLQSTYKLPARQLAYGQLIDNLSTPQLSAAQCLEVGRHAYSQGDFEQSEEWFRVAYDRLFDELEQKKEVDAQGTTIASDETEENGETEPTVGQILDYLAYSLGRQGRYAEALNVTRLLIEEEVLGGKKHHHKEWISLETLGKIKERKNKKIAINKSRSRAEKVKAQAEYTEANKQVKRGIRADKQKYVGELARTAEKTA